MSIKVLPLGDRVLVKRILQPEKSQGGIFIPDSSRMNTSVAEVLFTSDDIDNKGLKAGDKIVVGRYSGIDISIEGLEVTLLRIEDIVGKIVRVEE